MRLANLLHLRQHASIDLYVDEVLQHAKVIIVDHLGGESYWPYGTERIVNLCRARAIVLAMFSGDASEDANLLARSTAPAAVCRQLWRYLREGGADNARQFYAFIAQRFFEHDTPVLPPVYSTTDPPARSSRSPRSTPGAKAGAPARPCSPSSSIARTCRRAIRGCSRRCAPPCSIAV